MSFILSSLIFLPLLAAVVVLVLPKGAVAAIRAVALLATFLELVLAVVLFVAYRQLPEGIQVLEAYQFVEQASWIGMSLGQLGYLQINYFLGVDGVSVAMVLLTGIVTFLGVISSWNIHGNPKGYFGLYLLLTGSIVGCFVALDLFLFYLFFEFMLLPMYFLIGIWGGVRREYAAIKFFIYTLIGSLFILIVMIGLYTSVLDPAATAYRAGLVPAGEAVTPELIRQVQQLLATRQLDPSYVVHTFSIPDLTQATNFIPGSFLHPDAVGTLMGFSLRSLAFLLLFAGFAIKVPVVPVHTWLPDAHVEAPTPISVILAAVLLKVGAYGLIRIAFPVFPAEAADFSVLIGGLGVLSIVYGAFCALAQNDLKRLIAYSSVSHMGFVLLGLASFTVEGVNGAVYQMFSHGLISAMLFMLVGVIYDRTHERGITQFRGLAAVMPAYTTLVVIAFFASLGLPGLSGFIAELLVLLGAFASATVTGMLPRWMAIVATLGLILGAAYYLWTLQRMFFGKPWMHPDIGKVTSLQDLSARELTMLVPLAVLILVFGIFPFLLLDKVSPDVAGFVQRLLAQSPDYVRLMLR
jgi:NADH-quinone oxidoreductase subunit M